MKLQNVLIWLLLSRFASVYADPGKDEFTGLLQLKAIIFKLGKRTARDVPPCGGLTCMLQDEYLDEYSCTCKRCCYTSDEQINNGAILQAECLKKNSPCVKYAMWSVCGGDHTRDTPAQPNAVCTGAQEPTTGNISTTEEMLTSTPFTPTSISILPSTQSITTNMSANKTTSDGPVHPSLSERNKGWIPGTVVGVIILAIAVGAVCWKHKPWRKKEEYTHIDNNYPESPPEPLSPEEDSAQNLVSPPLSVAEVSPLMVVAREQSFAVTAESPEAAKSGDQVSVHGSSEFGSLSSHRSSQGENMELIVRETTTHQDGTSKKTSMDSVELNLADRQNQATDSGFVSADQSPVDIARTLSSICAGFEEESLRKFHDTKKDECDTIDKWKQALGDAAVDDAQVTDLTSMSLDELSSRPDCIKEAFVGNQPCEDKLVSSLKFAKGFKPMHPADPSERERFVSTVEKVLLIFSGISAENGEKAQNSVTSVLSDDECQDITDFINLLGHHPDFPEQGLRNDLNKVKAAVKRSDSTSLKEHVKDLQRRMRNHDDFKLKTQKDLAALKQDFKVASHEYEYPEEPVLTAKCQKVLNATGTTCSAKFDDIVRNMALMVKIKPYFDCYGKGEKLRQGLARLMECTDNHNNFKFYKSENYSVIESLLKMKEDWPLSVLFICLRHFEMQKAIDKIAAWHKECPVCSALYRNLKGDL